MTEPNATPPLFVQMLSKILLFAELIASAASVAGLALHFMGATMEAVLTLGFTLLAMVYFLQAFMPPMQAGPPEDKGFAGLLPTITSKVIGIGMAVCSIGILFSATGKPGAVNILQIGVPSVVLAIVIDLILVATNPGRLVLVKGSLLRAIPVAGLSAYFLALSF